MTDGDPKLCAISRPEAEMKNDELALRLITSQSERMKLDEFVMLFRHRYMIFLYLVPILTLALTNVRASQGVPRWIEMALHTLGVLLFIVTLVLIVTGLRRLVRRPEPLRLHLTPPILCALVVAFGATDWIANRVTGRTLDFPYQTLAFFLMVWCVTEITFSISAGFVLPRVLAEMRSQRAGGSVVGEGEFQTALDAAPPEAPPLPETVEIGGRQLRLSELAYIVADGNSVQVHFGTLSLRLSARFAAVVASVPMQAGMQIHRSVWVSSGQAARASLDRSGREIVLRLADGTRLPVAQSRRTEVAAWLRSLGVREG